jgi:hypothetical protein
MMESNVIRRADQLLRMEEKQSAYKVLEGMPEEKNSLGVH